MFWNLKLYHKYSYYIASALNFECNIQCYYLNILNISDVSWLKYDYKYNFITIITYTMYTVFIITHSNIYNLKIWDIINIKWNNTYLKYIKDV